MRIMFEHLLISVDLSMVHPKQEQICESQPEHCVVIWKGGGCNILKRRAGIHRLLKIGPLSGISS